MHKSETLFRQKVCLDGHQKVMAAPKIHKSYHRLAHTHSYTTCHIKILKSVSTADTKHQIMVWYPDCDTANCWCLQTSHQKHFV